MAKGTVVWNSIETWQRLVASMVASGGKVSHYGCCVTYCVLLLTIVM